jgi:hypothetical protein
MNMSGCGYFQGLFSLCRHDARVFLPEQGSIRQVYSTIPGAFIAFSPVPCEQVQREQQTGFPALLRKVGLRLRICRRKGCGSQKILAYWVVFGVITSVTWWTGMFFAPGLFQEMGTVKIE